MPVANDSALKAFLLENGNSYPCNDILTARNAIHARWLIVESGSYGFVNHAGDRPAIALPSTTFSAATVLHLLVTKQALPVPNVVANVLDYMECWGKEHDSEWHDEAVTWIAYLLKNKIHCTEEELFYDLIEFKIKGLIYECIGLNEHLAATRIFDLWKEQLNYNCCYSGVRDFKQAATNSFTAVMVQVNAYLQVQSSLTRGQSTPPRSDPVSPNIVTPVVTVKEE